MITIANDKTPWLEIVLFISILTAIICGASSCNPEPCRADTILTASWYSIDSLKKEGTYKYSKGVMANGKTFDEEALTCATRDFELGTFLKITNKATGKSVYVKVTDRIGRRFKGKRIDLSKKAFSQIADLKQGLVSCKVEVINAR